MPEAVVDAFEAVQVAQKDGERIAIPTGTRDLLLQFNANGTCIWQAGKKVCTGSVLSSFKLNGVLDRDSQFRTGREKKPEMVLSESLSLAEIQRKNSGYTVSATQWNGESRLQHRDFCNVAHILGLGSGFAVYDWLFSLGDPTGYALTKRNFKGPEKFKIHSVYVAWHQLFVAQDVKDDRVIRDHFLQADGNNGQRFAQAKGVAHVLSELEQELSFLPRGNDGRQERRSSHLGLARDLCESRRWRGLMFHGGKRLERIPVRGDKLYNGFQFFVTAADAFNNSGVVADTAFRL